VIDLFESAGLGDDSPRPLADRLRPTKLSEIVGQDHLLGDKGPIARMVAAGKIASMVLWGPPGTGKTTTARLLAGESGLYFEQISAIFSGVADLKRIFKAAEDRRKIGQGTLLFVDEIHRFNRAQQDGFLPHVENGTVILVGATTENPSFELNGALLSRMQVMVLNRHDDGSLEQLLSRAETDMGRALPLSDDARAALKAMADGDGRYLLNCTETIDDLTDAGEVLDPAGLATVLQKKAPAYDKNRDEHFNLISALHKSLRGSDPDAALYWTARMIAGGEDPMYLIRRLVRFASEDIGVADPNATVQALAAKDAWQFLGPPEAETQLAQAVIYLATAPKSNAAYTAWKSAKKMASATGSLMPPKHILNAPTKMMDELGYGEGYAYDHDTEDGFSGQNYFPDDIDRQTFYKPKDRGFEREVKKRITYWSKLRREQS